MFNSGVLNGLFLSNLFVKSRKYLNRKDKESTKKRAKKGTSRSKGRNKGRNKGTRKYKMRGG